MAQNDGYLLSCQNEVIISLLANLSIGVERVRELVTEKKRNPEAYVKTYNALDGSIGVVEAAKIAGVDKSTMSSILKRWEANGIVYDSGAASKPEYRRILTIPPGM